MAAQIRSKNAGHKYILQTYIHTHITLQIASYQANIQLGTTIQQNHFKNYYWGKHLYSIKTAWRGPIIATAISTHDALIPLLHTIYNLLHTHTDWYTHTPVWLQYYTLAHFLLKFPVAMVEHCCRENARQSKPLTEKNNRLSDAEFVSQTISCLSEMFKKYWFLLCIVTSTSVETEVECPMCQWCLRLVGYFIFSG